MFNVLISKREKKKLLKVGCVCEEKQNQLLIRNLFKDEPIVEFDYDEELHEIIICTENDVAYVEDIRIFIDEINMRLILLVDNCSYPIYANIK